MNKTNITNEFISFVVFIDKHTMILSNNEPAEAIQMINTIDLFSKVTGLNKVEKEIRQAITELKAYSDRELQDIGIARGDIEYIVRHGANDDVRKETQKAA